MPKASQQPITFTATPKFQKDFKKLYKRFRTLKADLGIVKLVIAKYPTGEDSRHAHILKTNPDRTIFLIKRRLVSRSTKHSDFRIIYIYHKLQNTVTFIEIYFKGTQPNHNYQRAEDAWKEVTRNESEG